MLVPAFSAQIISRPDSQSKFQSCLHYFPAAMLRHHIGARTWRFDSGLCKFLQNIATNICSLGNGTDLKLGEVSSSFICYKITISILYPPNGFRFISLLRDSESDLLFS